MGFVAGAAKCLTRTPLVITMHGRDVYVNRESGFIVPTLWYVKPFLHFAFRQADRLVAISRDCRSHALRAGAPLGKIRVIVNGVDTRRFYPSASGCLASVGIGHSPVIG